MRSLLLALALAACSNSSGGQLISVPMQAGGVARDPAQPFTFTTGAGWTVTLSSALIAAGPFYFNVNPPSTSEFRSGLVIIEATEQVIVNALDPTLYPVPGGADGETGQAVAVEIGLLPPDATNATATMLGNGFAYVSGTAVKGPMSVSFAGPITIDASLVTASSSLADLERVKGAATALGFTGDPQTLELRVDPTHWFDQADFSTIPGGTWTVDSTFNTQLLEGVKGDTDVYLFQLQAMPSTGESGTTHQPACRPRSSS